MSTLQDTGNPGSLRYAVNQALPKSTITFDTSLHGTILLTNGDLNIAKDLTIHGPGASILSISRGNTDHQVHVYPEVNASISDLTITGDNDTRSVSKAALLNNNGTLVLHNSVVSNNKSQNSGGILNNCARCASGASLTLIDSEVFNNISETGGGINNYDSLTLINSMVSGNIDTCGKGGGIYNAGQLTLTDSTVSENEASSRILSSSCGLGEGGGIYNEGALTLTDSTISGNQAMNGAGISSSNGDMILTNTTISSNNASNDGGGIETKESKVRVVFCTIYGNTAASNGGGIVNEEAGGTESQVTMSDSISANNRAHTGPDVEGKIMTYGYNLFQNFSGITFVDLHGEHATDKRDATFPTLGIDPVLRNNAGPTLTHALFQGSPAIDAIPFDVCSTKINGIVIITDQRGVKRPDRDEDRCDIGAYEYADTST